jgi:monovalent cation:H+ antiporter, CPA1 family
MQFGFFSPTYLTFQNVIVDVTQLVKVSIILLLLATGVALLSRRLRIPYVTGLVLAGLPITELLSRPIGLNPTLVLNLFLQSYKQMWPQSDSTVSS